MNHEDDYLTAAEHRAKAERLLRRGPDTEDVLVAICHALLALAADTATPPLDLTTPTPKGTPA